MNLQVQQYHQDEHQKKVHHIESKNQRMTDLQKQMEDNKRLKDQKQREEKQRDADLVKEYDRILLEREHQRTGVRLIIMKRKTGGAQQQPVSMNAYNPSLGGTNDRNPYQAPPGKRQSQGNNTLTRMESGGMFGGHEEISKDSKKRVGCNH